MSYVRSSTYRLRRRIGKLKIEDTRDTRRYRKSKTNTCALNLVCIVNEYKNVESTFDGPWQHLISSIIQILNSFHTSNSKHGIVLLAIFACTYDNIQCMCVVVWTLLGGQRYEVRLTCRNSMNNPCFTTCANITTSIVRSIGEKQVQRETY